MKEKRERLQAIEARKLELRSDLENSEKDINLEEVNTELDTLNAEEVQIKEEIKVEEETRSNLVKGFDKGFKKVEEPLEKKGKNMEQENIFESKEYRAGFLKQLQGKKLNEVEERAMTSAADSVGVMVPTVTQDLIMKQVEQSAPLLQEIELLRVNGNVTFAIEADATDANVHVEGATITEDGDVLIPVSLSSYEITKYITISKTVAKMSIDAFEKWLVNMIAERVARKITKLIISGTGTNQPKGIALANTWGASNSVTVALNASLTEANVTDAIALLPGAYDANAKWLMSKKTLFADYRPLQDKSKNNVFVKEGNTYFVEGYPVMLDDSISLHDAYLGDFKKYAGNLSEDVTVDTGKKLSSNSFEYLGCAMFDGKPAIGEAFVKITKATE